MKPMKKILYKNISIEDFDYDLPEERIAFYPLEERNQSRLLVYRNHTISDSHFDRLPHFLNQDHRLIFNNSKVIHARLLTTTPTGARIEIFCLEPVYPSSEINAAFQQKGKVVWNCMVGNAKRWKEPFYFTVPLGQTEIRVSVSKGDNHEGIFPVSFEWEEPVSFAEWVEKYGTMPLPPYIKRKAEKEDEQRYQTVYAEKEGSVAAPTAGLHFSEKELDVIRHKGISCEYVTLHVGAGTFKPVSTEEIGSHVMHREPIAIRFSMIENLLKYPEKTNIAVGTTVARTLESLFIIGAKLKKEMPMPLEVAQWEYYENNGFSEISTEEALQAILRHLENEKSEYLTGSTRLMIVPGYRHRLTRGIITNFHQPKSTLLLLIASFLGEEWKTIYQHALENEYRFLSYGDANLYLFP